MGIIFLPVICNILMKKDKKSQFAPKDLYLSILILFN